MEGAEKITKDAYGNVVDAKVRTSCHVCLILSLLSASSYEVKSPLFSFYEPLSFSSFQDLFRFLSCSSCTRCSLLYSNLRQPYI